MKKSKLLPTSKEFGMLAILGSMGFEMDFANFPKPEIGKKLTKLASGMVKFGWVDKIAGNPPQWKITHEGYEAMGRGSDVLSSAGTKATKKAGLKPPPTPMSQMEEDRMSKEPPTEYEILFRKAGQDELNRRAKLQRKKDKHA